MFQYIRKRITHLDGFDRVIHVVWGRGGTRQVIDLVHFDVKRLDDVLMDQLEILVPDPVLDIALAPGEEVVDDNHLST